MGGCHSCCSDRSTTKEILTSVLSVFLFFAIFSSETVCCGADRYVDIAAGNHVEVVVSEGEHLEIIKSVVKQADCFCCSYTGSTLKNNSDQGDIVLFGYTDECAAGGFCITFPSTKTVLIIGCIG